MQTVEYSRHMEISVRSTTRLMTGADPQLAEVAQWAAEDGETGLQIRVSPAFYR